MESNSLRRSISQDELRIINKANSNSNNTNMKPEAKAKASSKHNNTRGDEEDDEEEKDIVGFLWPSSRAYTCGFCKRQFRSAQALGGHMNVHRRDRAKLRRSSPPLDYSTQHHDFLGSSSQQPIKFLKLCEFSSSNNGEEESDGERSKIWKKVKKFVKKETGNLLGSSNEIDLELKLGF